jgi:hypothetical protein
MDVLEILSTRFLQGENSTISKVTVDGNKQCFFLEDVDRGLLASMTLDEIAHIKKKAITAIPEGRYRVTIAWSPRFKKMMPRILGVPGFDGILMHSGNTHLHTEGCPITGKDYQKSGKDYVIKGGTSKPAYEELLRKIQDAIKAGSQVFITIKSAYNETDH